MKCNKLFSFFCIIFILAMCVQAAPGEITRYVPDDKTFFEPEESGGESELTAEESGGESELSTEVVSNEHFIMLADMTTGLFSIENRASGYVWHSIPSDFDDNITTIGPQRRQLNSQVYIAYKSREDELTKSDIAYASSQTDCVENGTVTVKRIKNGIRVEYLFENVGIMIPVEYVLYPDRFDASVIMTDIDEGDKSFLMNVFLLPTFGADSSDDGGYVFVPDGCGTLVDFSEKPIMTDTAVLPVYGAEHAVEKEKETYSGSAASLPVFGIVSGGENAGRGNALFGIIHEGSGASSLKITYRNKFCGFSGVNAVIDYRSHSGISMYKTTYDQTLYHVSRLYASDKRFTVRYYFLSGDDADYTGMAKRYREYLSMEKALAKKTEKPAFHLELYGLADITATFFGIKYTSMKKLTTFDQAGKIVNALRNEGIDSLSVRYVGWTNNGILNNKMISKAAPLSKLGGTSAWNKMSETLAAANIRLYADIDFLQFRSSGRGVSAKKDSIHTSFGRIAEQHSFSPSTLSKDTKVSPVMLLNATALVRQAKKVAESAKNLKAVGLGTLGYMNYSDLNEQSGEYRSTFSSAAVETVRLFRDSEKAVGVECANDYLLPYVDCVWDSPIYSGGLDIYATDVPFYQIALHSMVTLTTPPVMQMPDPRTAFLKAVETGTELLYGGMYENAAVLTGSRHDGLYASTYMLWMKRAAKEYKEYMPLLSKIWNSEITGHYESSDGVFITEYANGTKVCVNYTGSDITLDSGEICGAMDFKEVN